MNVLAILDVFNASTSWLLALNPALGYTLMGLLLTALIGTAGFALARLRLSPLWALTLLVPLLGVIMLWVLAYCRWPADVTITTSKAE